MMTQTVYINQLLATYQMFNCTTTLMSMVERLALTAMSNDFESSSADITAYKYFIESI